MNSWLIITIGFYSQNIQGGDLPAGEPHHPSAERIKWRWRLHRRPHPRRWFRRLRDNTIVGPPSSPLLHLHCWPSSTTRNFKPSIHDNLQGEATSWDWRWNHWSARIILMNQAANHQFTIIHDERKMEIWTNSACFSHSVYICARRCSGTMKD